MNQRNTYELMTNILNDYLITWRKITILLFNEIYNLNQIPVFMISLYVVLLIFILVSLIIMHKLLTKYVNEKEKPIDIFLTIKKQKFEELKNSSEVFLNKMLNKILGNDETEQETINENNSINVASNSNEIIISKLNLKSMNSSNKSNTGFIISYIKILSYFIGIFIYFLMQLLLFNNTRAILFHYSKIANVTKYCVVDTLSSVNFVKSVLFDQTLPISNEEYPIAITKQLLGISDSFEAMLSDTYQDINYISKVYYRYFYQRVSGDIEDIQWHKTETKNIYWTLKHGFKSVLIVYYEIIKFIGFTFSANVQLDMINVKYFEDISKNIT